ncbi:MAG: hypothetical protein GEU82_08025 [Luteitalea sp.]|nr:hypothetical protein [Luteitalea sp.]
MGAAFFVFRSEQLLSARRAALRAFDQSAREAVEYLADVRAGQQAYLSIGQGVTLWMPKVAAMLERTAATVDTLRASAASLEARQLLVDVSAAITELSNVDRRARDYLRAGEQLMAGDVVFTEGSGVAVAAGRQVETSRLAEYRSFDAEETSQRRLEAVALAGAAGLSALVLAMLAFTPGPAAIRRAGLPVSAAMDRHADDIPLRQPAAPTTALGDDIPRGPGAALGAAASLCTDFARVKDLAGLTALLPQAATQMGASGLIVWLGNPAGRDLRPVLAHGYSEQTLARIPPVPRSANNAAAAAYRTGSLQIVGAPPGAAVGALVAPLLAAEGCIGALTAEIRGGGETSNTVQALAAIFAAQLATVFSASADAAPASDSPGTAARSRVVSA